MRLEWRWENSRHGQGGGSSDGIAVGFAWRRYRRSGNHSNGKTVATGKARAAATLAARALLDVGVSNAIRLERWR